MQNKSPFLSIVTPTYNRGSLLSRCYESLSSQTNTDFEWIIVDDGSTDDTAAVVSVFSQDKFPVTYVKKENGGKHTALNASHGYIQGSFVLILDSDDYLTNDAVQLVKNSWAPYVNDSEVGVVTLLRGKTTKHPLCIAPTPDLPVDLLRCKRKKIFSSDCCEVIRTELFLKYPFPIFQEERFLSEGALWCRVALTHKCVYINKVIYLCEYLEGGLTKSGRSMRIRNPLGGMYSSELCMHPKNFFLQRVKKSLLYCCYGFFADKSFMQILKETKYPFLVGCCLIPGFIMYKLWKKKYTY